MNKEYYCTPFKITAVNDIHPDTQISTFTPGKFTIHSRTSMIMVVLEAHGYIFILGVGTVQEMVIVPRMVIN